jgi:uncharacterized protein YbgA (DUF1722 family)/uncharacterized protein YbbK (DUF523 family)
LLGDEVRYNGGHKRSRICLNALNKVFEYHSYCPEMAIGLGVPRETIRIVEVEGEHRVQGSKTQDLDVTEPLFEYGREIGKVAEAFSGYILMKDSPSCGLYSARVHRNGQALPQKHSGLFVRGLREVQPDLPMEEEGRLNDPVLRENFVALVFAYDDWKTTVAQAPSPRRLVEFHSRYKYLVMAHSQGAYKSLGHIVAEAGKPGFDERLLRYKKEFIETLRKPANRKGHVNVMYHILGYLKDQVSSEFRTDLVKVIESYRLGAVNLSVPATMLSHYLKHYGSEYINEQAYLHPYSDELGLRNLI